MKKVYRDAELKFSEAMSEAKKDLERREVSRVSTEFYK